MKAINSVLIVFLVAAAAFIGNVEKAEAHNNGYYHNHPHHAPVYHPPQPIMPPAGPIAPWNYTGFNRPWHQLYYTSTNYNVALVPEVACYSGLAYRDIVWVPVNGCVNAFSWVANGLGQYGWAAARVCNASFSPTLSLRYRCY